MSLKGIVRDGIGGISRRGFSDTRRKERERGRSVAASSSSLPDVGPGVEGGQGSWAGLPPELLREVIGRVEQSEAAWPGRRHLVACASVCRSWRRVCKDIVGAPEVSGKLTFPVSLKQVSRYKGPSLLLWKHQLLSGRSSQKCVIYLKSAFCDYNARFFYELTNF